MIDLMVSIESDGSVYLGVTFSGHMGASKKKVRDYEQTPRTIAL